MIEPEALGATLMHEHVFCDLRTPALAAERDQGAPITLETLHDVSYGRQKHAGKYVLDRLDLAIEVRPANSGRSAAWISCSESVSRCEVA